MNVSFHGIGQWFATFLAPAVSEEEECKTVEGTVVKVGGQGTIAACAAGDAFCGVIAAGGRDGLCSVQLGGFATIPYTGTAPALGLTALAADGSGGVKADAGQTGGTYLVAEAADGSAVVLL